jgi:hypothetical protein
VDREQLVDSGSRTGARRLAIAATTVGWTSMPITEAPREASSAASELPNRPSPTTDAANRSGTGGQPSARMRATIKV